MANGLPFVLPLRDRARDLPARLAPFAAAICGMACLVCVWVHVLSRLVATGFADGTHPDEITVTAEQAALCLVAFIAPFAVLAGVGAIGAAVRGRTRQTRRIVAACCGVVALLVGPATWPFADYSEAATRFAAWVRLSSGTVAVALLAAAFLVASGLASVGRWSLLRGARELRTILPLITRALPLLVVTLLFCFFNAEIWQVAASLTWKATWTIVAGLLVLAIVLVWVINAERCDDLAKAPVDRRRDAELLAGTGMTAGTGQVARLRRAERVNLILIPACAQTFQTLFFVAIVCAMLLACGLVSIPTTLLQQWSPGAPHPLAWAGITLPLGREYLQVALILAAFSGLSFAASAAYDQTYRRDFVDPVMHEVERCLAARRSWLTQFPRR